jgi:phosphoribosylformimino-5-aminoimidazole carboxamide ribotide isomerase
MKIIPAVDISGGRCVRLTRGKLEESKVYFQDPLEAARRWADLGAEMLHVVDLDAASGVGSNFEIIRRLISSIGVPVEVGGGIRSLEKATSYVDSGAERVIFGTAALEMKLVREGLRTLGSRRVMAAVDHLAGRVAVRGWKEMTGIDALALSKRLEEEGVRQIMMTSVDRDGTMKGPNLEYSMKAVEALNGSVYLAGGFRSVDDLVRLRGTRVAGVILGKALYEGALGLREAVEAVR